MNTGKRVKENLTKSPPHTVRVKSLTFQVAPFLGRPSWIPPCSQPRALHSWGHRHARERQGRASRKKRGSGDSLLWGQHTLANLRVSA